MRSRADLIVRAARSRSELSLRALAAAAGTSHATLAAYEAGRVDPALGTLRRIARAAGFDLVVTLEPRMDRTRVGGLDHQTGDGSSTSPSRGDELEAALELAAVFPARHSAELEMPPFGRRVVTPEDGAV